MSTEQKSEQVASSVDASVGQQVEACRPSGNVDKKRAGIGMPATLYLQRFGDLLWDAFGEVAYQVGSSLSAPTWRDVDVRIMLDDEKYAALGFGDPTRPHENGRWCAYTLAFCAIGRQITGLPIDFQIQDTTTANGQHKGQRSALFTIREQPNPAFEPTAARPGPSVGSKGMLDHEGDTCGKG